MNTRLLGISVIWIAFVCVCTTVVTAQKPTPTPIPKNPLVGKWKSTEAAIEIRANGTMTINGDEYAYKVKGAVITVANDEGAMMFPYELDGDILTVEAQGREVVYKRIKDTGTGSGAGVGPERAWGQLATPLS